MNRPTLVDNRGRRGQATFFLCGDVMTGRGVDQVLPHSCSPVLHESAVRSALRYVELAERTGGPIPRPVRYDYVWGDALEALARVRPDVRIINLETSITTSDDYVPKGINYRMHPANVAVLTVAGIDCSVLANNHVLDWGERGLLDTLDALARAGVPAAGAGLDLPAARKPAIVQLPAQGRALVFAFGTTDSGIPRAWAAGSGHPGVHLLPDFGGETIDDIACLVRAAKRPSDVAIASIHWGGNWGFQIASQHRNFAHALIERAGIDLVHGHSSHHPKAIEVHCGRLILYGCGDFLSDYEGIRGYGEFRDDLVLMYFPTLDLRTGELVRLVMRPLQLRNFRLNRPSPADRAWLLGTLDRECRRFGQRIRAQHDETFVLEAV